MSDKKKDFHEFAFKSSLFKGRTDWYFCFLKSERIAHVLAMLAASASEIGRERMQSLVLGASLLPSNIAHMAAGNVEVTDVLADVFALTANIRILATAQVLAKETVAILVDEYEAVAQKLDAGSRVSPFVSPEDFIISSLPEQAQLPTSRISGSFEDPLVRQSVPHIKDINKGQEKIQSKSQDDRSLVILDFIKKNGRVSIKDICTLQDPAVRNCSEKTIQRELNELIRLGYIKREGERRWSVYILLGGGS